MNLCEVSSQLAIAVRRNVDTFMDWSESRDSGTRSRDEHSNDRAEWEDASRARTDGVEHAESIGCEGEST